MQTTGAAEGTGIAHGSRGAPAAQSDGLDVAFPRIRDFLAERAGIQLTEQKTALVRARLTRRLRATGSPDFGSYLDAVERPGGEEEAIRMIDLLTTNKTSFFRESAHYQYLLEHVLSGWARGTDPITIWSAGCSSGAEPYSFAMMLLEQLPARRAGNVRILATDLSTEMVARTRSPSYREIELEGLSAERRDRFLTRESEDRWTVVPEVRRMVRPARLNLMGAWPMSGPFDLILCCNVMIYFSRETRSELVRRFGSLLGPGAHLMVGHSESLGGIEHGLDYVRPAIYRRP